MKHLPPRTPLNRLFFQFPAGSAGVALLGLRVMSGGAALAVGVAYADGWSVLWSSRLGGLVLIVDGILLLLGLLTPVAGLIAPILACAAAFQWLLPASPLLLEIRTVALPFSVITLSLVALGPGAYSLDARIFGRKELRIPRRFPPDNR